MNSWFLCKIRYIQIQEDGAVKKARETYLTDAITFTDAESRMHEEVGAQMDDFTVTSVSKANFSDVFFYTDADTWFRVKVQYRSFDEDKQKEKLITDTMLIAAPSLNDALERIQEKLKDMQVPYEVAEIVKTPILEVFRYKSPDERVPVNLKPMNSDN